MSNHNNYLEGFNKELGGLNSNLDPLKLSKINLDNTAFHDFSYYEFLYPTEIGLSQCGLGALSTQAINFLEQSEDGGVEVSTLEWMAEILFTFETELICYIRKKLSFFNEEQFINETLNWLYGGALGIPVFIIELFSVYEKVGESITKFKKYIKTSLIPSYLSIGAHSGYTIDLASPNPQQSLREFFETTFANIEWIDFYEENKDICITDEGVILLHCPISKKPPNFEIFPTNSINIGLRLIFRQEWTPLGFQKGEIVKTIPLGPGQTQRVSTKITRRRKRTSTMESLTSKETTEESTTTDKTSTGREASQEFGSSSENVNSSEIVNEAASSLNWNVETEASGGIGFASASVKAGIGGESSDRSQNTDTSQSTQSNKAAEQSKTTSSRLSESMKKAASKIRRETKIVVSIETEDTFEQEVFSEITNTNNEKALTYEYHKLQQQYEVFTYLEEVQGVIFVAEDVPKFIDIIWISEHDWIISKVLKDESFRGALNDLINNPAIGVSNDEKYSLLVDEAKGKFAKFEGQSGDLNSGLNIPDIYSQPLEIYQREKRYTEERTKEEEIKRLQRERLIKHLEDNILYYCRAIWSNEDPDQRLLRYKKENRRIPVEWEIPLNEDGPINLSSISFQAQPKGTPLPLWEIIDPSGPISYIGNYAIFGIKPSPEFDNIDDGTMSLNGLLSLLRIPYLDENDQADLLDPALKAFRAQAENPKSYGNNIGIEKSAEGKVTNIIKLNEEKVLDIISYLPRLQESLIQGNDDGGYEFLINEDGILKNPIKIKDWAEYIYRKNGTRRFLVDSNNLYLSIRLDDGSTFEPFKRAHRYLDVLKSNEELMAMQLKNERRSRHLDEENVYDPDVRKVIIIDNSDHEHTSHSAALDESRDDGFGDDAPHLEKSTTGNVEESTAEIDNNS